MVCVCVLVIFRRGKIIDDICSANLFTEKGERGRGERRVRGGRGEGVRRAGGDPDII